MKRTRDPLAFGRDAGATTNAVDLERERRGVSTVFHSSHQDWRELHEVRLEFGFDQSAQLCVDSQ